MTSNLLLHNGMGCLLQNYTPEERWFHSFFHASKSFVQGTSIHNSGYTSPRDFVHQESYQPAHFSAASNTNSGKYNERFFSSDNYPLDESHSYETTYFTVNAASEKHGSDGEYLISHNNLQNKYCPNDFSLNCFGVQKPIVPVASFSEEKCFPNIEFIYPTSKFSENIEAHIKKESDICDAHWKCLSTKNSSINQLTPLINHKTNLVNHKKGDSIGEKPYICHLCNKSFSTKSNLTNHVKVHSGRRPYPCEICGKRFSQRGNLNRHRKIHTREIHTMLKDEEDDLELYTTSSVTSLPWYDDDFTEILCTKNVGSTETKLSSSANPCNLFEEFSHLDLSFSTEEKNHIKKYACHLCSKSFSTSTSLINHKRVHTRVKPYQCEYCCKMFAQRGSLTYHRRIHTGERPHKCEQCEKCFHQKSNLNQHERIHTREKPYKCDFCTKSFVSKGNLTSHRRIHTGEKPYACDFCGKCFAQKNNMVQHKKIHTRANNGLVSLIHIHGNNDFK